MRHGRPLDQVVVGLVPGRLRLEHSRRSLPGDLDDADVLFGGRMGRNCEKSNNMGGKVVEQFHYNWYISGRELVEGW